MDASSVEELVRAYVLIDIHVFLGGSHKNTNTVFRLFNPVYDMDMPIFKIIVFMKQAKSE